MCITVSILILICIHEVDLFQVDFQVTLPMENSKDKTFKVWDLTESIFNAINIVISCTCSPKKYSLKSSKAAYNNL